MRYHYKQPALYLQTHGETYECNSPIYSRCTLYFFAGRGLAVIQQRYSGRTKSTYWTDIDPWLIDDLYNNPNFDAYFKKYAAPKKDGLYPTVTIRQIMWALKMKPLKRKVWETVFDKCPII